MTRKFAASFLLLIVFCISVSAQGVLTPEMLWKLGKVGGEMISPDGKNAIYGVTFYNMAENKGERESLSLSCQRRSRRSN
jgi:hypothetical protein